jgi:cell division protein FtsW
MGMFSRTDKSMFSQWWWTVDRGMLAAFVTLAICGVLLVATASPSVAERIHVPYHHFVVRHLIFLGPSLALLVGLSLLSHKFVRRLASIVFGLSIAAMIAVLVVGTEIKGAQRWINLGFFSLQPSEFLKPSFAVLAAWMMAMQKEKQGFPGYVIAGCLYGLGLLLLILQPDFGMSFLLTAILAIQIFLAGFPFRILALLLVLGVAGACTAYMTLDHVRSRIDRYWDPAAGDTYQVDKSLQAFQNGGLIGTGPGQGTVKMSLPDAHADFIFSVGGEEMGLLFVLTMLGLYGFIIIKGLNRLMDSSDMFVVLAVGGLLTMFGLQALVHMGSSMHLLPTKGMTLPFISYGGSSLLSMGFSMGLLLALTRRQGRSSVSRGGLSLHAPRVPKREGVL